ncbi:MAG: hypothetical protein ACK4P2_06065 [Hyphomonas sp.]
MTSDDHGPPPPPERILDRWGRWLTLGANVGVVLGLIILIVEVRQNAAMTRAAMEQEKNNFLAEIELNLARPEIASVWMKSIRNPEDLTDAELKTLDGLLVAVMLQWEHRFQMEAAGLISREDARQHLLNAAPYYFGSRFARHWWSVQTGGWGGSPMLDMAGPIVDATDENFLANYFDGLRLPPPDAEPAQPEVVP